MKHNLATIANDIQHLAQTLGADEVSVSVSQSVSTELTQRAGKIEKTKQANSFGAQVEILIDDKFSSHSASDVRPEALHRFLERAIQATKYLEPDPNRRLPPVESMGSTDLDLDVLDASWTTRTPSARKEALTTLEHSCIEHSQSANVRSITTHVWDGFVQSHVSSSNGYSAGWSRTSFGCGGEITLVDEGDRLPEAYDYRSVRHLDDLASDEEIAKTLFKRGQTRIGSSKIASDRMPLLLENRSASRLLGVLIGPLNGHSIYEQRSCLLGKLGEKIAASSFNLYDAPHLKRGLASKPYDGDGFATKHRSIIEDGVLQMYFINQYNARRLNVAPTTGSSSNLVIPPSNNSPEDLIRSLPKVISVEGFLGGNTNPITGDFSFGIHGRYFENGTYVQGVSEMNISGNLFELLEKFQTAANDVWTYSSYHMPSLLFDDMQFSGS